ncbi:hypothetical protein [Streptomyces poonensis]|uniref:Uncharacterized protein n=1 Tax=Streptomyces poonensis TaxID=68255 RepID=A0A918UPL1_9ACTN|nr:hypothetical protein [Streptomyces poonensis]GGZ26523.1 hypothetical protein GCM10010365_53640 [Streptomyces poonensis]GLJ88972.1 hypothetical protein GCM10017589_15720 [Streptomyces poonensis]
MDLPYTPDPRPYVPPAAPTDPHVLALPAELPAQLGYDAVGTPREHGERILRCLPRVGCVFADDERWWWIVPSGSHIGVIWPAGVHYAVGARVDAAGTDTTCPLEPSWTRTRPSPRPGGPRPDGPRLIHRPDDGSPYTPPIPLYFLTCRLTGNPPLWSLERAG